MFLSVNALGQGFRCVARMNGNDGLYNNRAAIKLFRNKVNTAAMLQIACIQRTLMRTQTGIAWQQGRVNIEQPASVMGHEALRQDTHEAGQDQEVWFKAINQLDEGSVERLPISELCMVKNLRLDARLASTLQSVGIRTVGNHRADLDGRLRAGRGIDQCLQVATGT